MSPNSLQIRTKHPTFGFPESHREPRKQTEIRGRNENHPKRPVCKGTQSIDKSWWKYASSARQYLAIRDATCSLGLSDITSRSAFEPMFSALESTNRRHGASFDTQLFQDPQSRSVVPIGQVHVHVSKATRTGTKAGSPESLGGFEIHCEKSQDSYSRQPF